MLGLGNSLARGGVLSGFENTYSLAFDGSNDYVVNDVADFRISDSLGTISVWVKFDVVNVSQRIFGSAIYSDRRYFVNLYLANDGKIKFEVRNGTSDTTDIVLYDSALSADVWYHVVVSSNGSAYSIYIDGASKTVTVGGGANDGRWFADISNRENFSIGALKHNSAIEGPVNGNIDEVAIWDVALDADAVSAIYNSGTPIALDADDGNYDNSGDLQCWWRMGDGILDDFNLIADQVNPTLGSELLSNGTFDSDTTGWASTSGNAMTLSQEDGIGGVDNVLKAISAGDGGNTESNQAFTGVSGTVYKLSFDIYIPSANDEVTGVSIYPKLGGSGGGLIAIVSDYIPTADTWVNKVLYTRQPGSFDDIEFVQSDGNSDCGESGDIIYLDNISFKAVNGNPGLMTNMASDDIVKDTP